jgi:uncharacterized membrane protein YhaH (DUF805 family)
MSMQITKITDDGLPNLFQAADCASKKAQSNYLWLMAFDLSFMILASGFAIYNYKSIDVKEWIYILSGILLLLGLVFTIIIKTKRFEDYWYQGRALAESCKTLSWRFMTCAEVFEINVDSATAEIRFVDKIKQLSQKFTDLNKTLSSNLLNKHIISNIMWSVRQLSTVERKEYYLKNRIREQKKWYSHKAEINRKRYNLWFSIILTSQALALTSVTYLIKDPNSKWNLVGLFTTVASCCISWLQLKQHQELKQAYTTAAQELGYIEALANQIHTDTELSKFVLDSENAISREHTLWLAQRRR